MPSRTTRLQEIEGYVPALDPRKLSVPHILEGKNFLWDLDGPYSGFGSSFVSYKYIANPTDMETFEVDGQVYIFAQDGVYSFDTPSRDYKLHFGFTKFTTRQAWSAAKVGSDYYFANAGLSNKILKLDVSTDDFTYITSNVPTGALAVWESFGRLVILGTSQYAWSALGDGTNLTPNLTTGAGAQGLSIVGGEALTGKALTDGFFVYTTNGIVKATYRGGVAVFRHDVLHGASVKSTVAPINSQVVVNIDNKQHIILDKTGLYASTGGQFTPYDPLMNDYITTTLFRYLSVNKEFVNFKLSYNADRQLLFFSVSSRDESESHNYAFCAIHCEQEMGTI
jgi:hypothetical protein